MILSDKKFSGLFWTQFLGALNDNFLKNALVIIITYKAVSLWGMNTQALVAFAAGIFILPFFLFSSLAGQIADKFQQATLVRTTKWTELFIMLFSAYGFYSENMGLLLISLFFMGAQSTFFGPMKYSMIPQLLPEGKLVTGNAYVETGTFIAILLGTIAGGLAAASDSAIFYCATGVIFFAVLGIITSLFVPDVHVGDKNLRIQINPFPEVSSNLKKFKTHKSLFNAMTGISWFWFYGAAILSLLPVYTKDVLNASEEVATFFLALFAIGIGFGSFLCAKISKGRNELGIVPIGTLGMSVFLLDLAYVSYHWAVAPGQILSLSQFFDSSGYSYRISFDLFMLAASGGVFTVPLYTLLQERSSPDFRSRVISTLNIINAFFMVVASVLIIIFTKLNITLINMFVIFALLNLIVSIYIYYVAPELTLRFYTWILTKFMYRLSVKGLENIPEKGACILVCNHVSFVDWLIIGGIIKRPVRFVMYYKFFDIPLMGWFFRHGKVIPIAGFFEDKKILEECFSKVSVELRKQQVVGIFPEGWITRDGNVQSFKKGIEHVIAKDAVPVIPMALKGLWGSIFSHEGRPAFTKVPRRFFRKVELVIGKPLSPENATAEVLESKVKELYK